MNSTAHVSPRSTAPIRRALVTAAMAAMAALLVFAMSGCSLLDPSKAIAEGLSKQLDALKNPTEAELNQYMGESAVSEMKKAGVDPAAFCKALFTHYEYQIKDVKMNGGDSATVQMHVKSIDLTELSANLISSLMADALTNPGKYSNMGDGEATKAAFEKMQEEATKSDAKTVESDVTVTIKKGSDGSWGIPSEADRTKMLFGDQGTSELFGSSSALGSGSSSDSSNS